MHADDQHIGENLEEYENLKIPTSYATIHECVQRWAQTLVAHLGVALARIWTLSEDEAMLELHASAGMYTHLDGAHRYIPMGCLMVGFVAAERRPYTTNALFDAPLLADRDWAKHEGLVAFAGYPLLVGEHLVGVAAIFARDVLTDASLQVMGLIADSIALDIERCRAENVLRQSGALFRTAFVNAGVGIALTDLAGHFLLVNHTYREIAGYSNSELLQTDLFSMTHPDDLERKMISLRALIAGEVRDFETEKRFRKRDGTFVWVRNRVSLVYDSQGQPLNIIAMIEDITRRKQAEEDRNQWLQRERKARAEAERAWYHLHELFQQAPAVICILRGPRHIYELANPYYQQIVGHRDLIGRSIYDVLPELKSQGVFERLDHVYQTGEAYVGNEVHERFDRHGTFEDVYFNFVYQPFRSVEGIIEGVLIYAIDVTEEVLARQRMDTFLGIASHELKTPLTSIKGNVQLAQRSIRRAVQETSLRSSSLQHRLINVQIMLERAEQQADFQNRLVGDLIDITRIQSDKLEMRMALTDLVTVVNNAVAEQRDLVPTRTIQFTPPVDDGIQLFIDGDRIGQVVTNFLTNAIKYSEDEAPVVVQIEHGATSIRVGVTDQGPGLSESQQQHLWEKFYRVPGVEVQSGSGVGLGLGLYICRTIITHHSGQVGVDSQIGVGSTFWFTLPTTTEEALA